MVMCFHFVTVPRLPSVTFMSSGAIQIVDLEILSGMMTFNFGQHCQGVSNITFHKILEIF